MSSHWKKLICFVLANVTHIICLFDLILFNHSFLSSILSYVRSLWVWHITCVLIAQPFKGMPDYHNFLSTLASSMMRPTWNTIQIFLMSFQAIFFARQPSLSKLRPPPWQSVNSSGGELVLSVSDLVSTLAKNLLAEEWTGHHKAEPIPAMGHIAFIFLQMVCSMTWQQWLFDSPMAPLRLLKFRGGHQMPPHLIQY